MLRLNFCLTDWHNVCALGEIEVKELKAAIEFLQKEFATADDIKEFMHECDASRKKNSDKIEYMKIAKKFNSTKAEIVTRFADY